MEKYQPRANPVQFSSEKLLEDELTARLEKGDEVFGMPLHIYKQKGEYGRQYIMNGVGRLDLLAEDNEGNLYVIELKKTAVIAMLIHRFDHILIGLKNIKRRRDEKYTESFV